MFDSLEKKKSEWTITKALAKTRTKQSHTQTHGDMHITPKRHAQTHVSPFVCTLQHTTGFRREVTPGELRLVKCCCAVAPSSHTGLNRTFPARRRLEPLLPLHGGITRNIQGIWALLCGRVPCCAQTWSAKTWQLLRRLYWSLKPPEVRKDE